MEETLQNIENEKEQGMYVRNLKFDRWGNLRTKEQRTSKKSKKSVSVTNEKAKEDVLYNLFKKMPKKGLPVDQNRQMLEKYREIFVAEE